jgi:hypothetical protein
MSLENLGWENLGLSLKIQFVFSFKPFLVPPTTLKKS